MKITPEVFCNSPWYELHIFWNGDLAFCCHQLTPPYDIEQKPNPYNIKTMSIKEWYNSEPMQQARMRMFEDKQWSKCGECWLEEKLGGASSRRHRSNQKSVIFRQNIQQSLEQSPSYPLIESSYNNNGLTTSPPVDLHIDLGNHCNLACKMCWPGASTTIATKMKKLDIMPVDQYLKYDWTKDQDVWDRFLNELVEIPNVKHIHIMGGEPTIHPRFKQLLDYLIANHNVQDYGFSFVTNGTKFDQSIIDRLKKFARASVEISVETAEDSNHYIRQGSVTSEVIENIKKYNANRADNFFVTLRPCVSALSLRDYWTLLKLALDEELMVKSRSVNEPPHLRPHVIPKAIRETYRQPYLDLLKEYNLDLDYDHIDINESHYENQRNIVVDMIKQALTYIDMPDHIDQKLQLTEMVKQMKIWDKEYTLDARTLYPELKEILDENGY